MRKGTIITLAASAVFGVLAIVLARGFINTAVNTQYEQARVDAVKTPKQAAKMKTVPVMVADMKLMPGKPLTAQSVNLVEFPAKSVPQGSYKSYEALFLDPNNPSVVLTQIAQGEPILSFKLSAPGGRASLSAQLGKNMRAVSIRVNDVSGVAGFVRPDDYVDVLLTRATAPSNISRYAKQKSGSDNKSAFLSEILLQDIKVLGTDQVSDTGSDAPKLAKTITLEVSPKQAQKLALGKSVGTLSLALRSASTNETLVARAIREKDLSINALSTSAPKPRRSVRRVKPKPKNQTAQIVVVRNGEPRLVKVYREQPQLQKLAGGTQ